MRLRLSTFIGFFCAFSSFALAQPLADKVPGDSIIYVGWAGSEALGADYDNSHLKGVLDASDAAKVVTDFIPKIFAKIGEKEPDAKQVGELISAIVKPMWQHPTAFYFAGFDFPDAGPPMPKVAVLCNAGPDAANLVAKVKNAIQQAGEQSPVPVSVTEQGGLVQLVVGKSGDATSPIANATAFKSALAKTHAKPIAVVYINGEQLIQQVNTGMEKAGSPKDRQEWEKLRTSLGLEGFKGLTWTAAFEDKNWSTRAFLAAPAPRAGVMKFLESQPLAEDALKVVPATAILAGAGKFDLTAAFDGIRNLIGASDPREAAQFDRELAKFNQRIGLNLRDDLLAASGDTWTYYIDPMTGGTGALGGVLLNRPRDAAKLEASLLKLQKAFNDLTTRQMRREGMFVLFKEAKVDGQTIHYLAIPIVTPSWTMKNGQWIIGLYPQTVLAAAKNMESGGKSILDNPAYVELRKKLGDSPAVSSVQFADLPKLAPASYSTWLLISRYAGMGDLFGVDAPLMILPPMFKLQQHLAASGMISWTTEEGVFIRSLSPFPGSTVISSDPLAAYGAAAPALMVSILLPSLNKARETANRVKCQSNLSQIGKAFLLYSNENKGKLPPDLGTLLLTQDMTMDVFTCPSSDLPGLPVGWQAMKREDQAKWVNENAHYVYVGPVGRGFMTAMGADDVLVYEKPGAHDHDGMNFLYADGHAEFQTHFAAEEEIERTKKKNQGGM